MKQELDVIRNPVLKQPGVITSIGLNLPVGLDEETWETIGLEFGRFGAAINWWIGDWWIYGEHEYGDRAAVIESEGWTGPAYNTCNHAANTCRAFEFSRRRLNLTFTHQL